MLAMVIETRIQEGGIMRIVDEKLWDIRSLTWSKTTGSVATDGVYMKTEIMIGGEKYYLKLSNYDSYRGIFGHEAINELIACRLGDLLSIRVPTGVLKKSLVSIEGKEYEAFVFAAKSYKADESREAFEDFYMAYRLSGDESPLDFCRRFDWEKEIYKMFIFDYLIINRDRHGANLEVLKNNKKRLSPLFDNGLSFVCSCTDELDLDAFNVMEDRPVNNFIGSRRLEHNLELIDKKVEFAELRESDKEKLFAGLYGVLPERYFTVMWEIIWRRWQNVEKFRIA